MTAGDRGEGSWGGRGVGAWAATPKDRSLAAVLDACLSTDDEDGDSVAADDGGDVGDDDAGADASTGQAPMDSLTAPLPRGDSAAAACIAFARDALFRTPPEERQRLLRSGATAGVPAGAPPPPPPPPPHPIYVLTIKRGDVYGRYEASAAVVGAYGTAAAAFGTAPAAMDAHAAGERARWRGVDGRGAPAAAVVTDVAAVVDGAALIDVTSRDGGDYTRLRVWVCGVPGSAKRPREGQWGGLPSAVGGGGGGGPLFVLTREAADADRVQRVWVEAVVLSRSGVGAAAVALLRRVADWGPRGGRDFATGLAAAAAIADRVADGAEVALSSIVTRGRRGAVETGAYCRLRVQVLRGRGVPGGVGWAATVPRRVVASVLQAQELGE